MESKALFEACGSENTAVQRAAYETLWHYLFQVAFQMTYRQPGGEALAQDCAQRALIRIHQQRQTVASPDAFRTWSRRIVTNLVIDELRRRKRLVFDDKSDTPTALADRQQVDDQTSPETAVAETLDTQSLRQLMQLSPLSDRSRRVVIGRYFDDKPDTELAQFEADLAQKSLRPSHIQVTRAKNIAKLREWDLLHQFLDEPDS